MPTMKITVKMANEALVALNELNGYPRIVGTGTAEQVVLTRYKFGAACLDIAKQRAALRGVVDVANEAIANLFNELADGKYEIDPQATPEIAKQFTIEREAINTRSIDIDVTPLTISQLRMEENDNLPASAIDVLLQVGLLTSE